MKWRPAVVLWLAHSLCTAQSLPEEPAVDASNSPVAQAQQALPAIAFELGISASEEIRTLLERHLALQRYRNLPDLSDDELDRLLDTARHEVQTLVGTLGYFSPVIQISQRSGSDETRYVEISVSVGEPVRVSQVLIRFAGAIADDPDAATQRQQILQSWSLPAGSRFTQTAWDSAKQQAQRLLSTQRFATGRLSQTLADIDPQAHTAMLTITLDSGPAWRLGPMNISGLERYDSALVQRLARLPAGLHYDLAQLSAAQQRLTESGFFSSAFVTLDTQSDPQAARVLVSLRENPLQKVIFGVGGSTDAGARLSVEHVHNQLPLLGWRANSKLSVDRETQYIGTSLTSPPDSHGWRWNTLLILLREPIGSQNISSQRLRVGAAQDGERIDRSYYLQYDRADSAATDEAPSVLAESISANYSFTRRQFDAMPFPSAGWAWGVELGGGLTLGSDRAPYGRVLTRWQHFWPLGSSNRAAPDLRAGRLSLRAQVGAVVAKKEASLPSTQLFLAGGDNSVRGYGLHDMGVELADGQVSAGRYLATGSLEWQRPITRNGLLTAWEGVLFVDAGAVADQPADWQAKVGIGIGARWKTPVGPLQVDLAYGVAVQKLRLHLNLGFVF